MSGRRTARNDQVDVLGFRVALDLRPEVEVPRAGRDQRVVDVRERLAHLLATARRERMWLVEMRDALAVPVDRVERLADSELVPFDECDPVTVAGQGKRRGEPGHTCAKHDDRKRRRRQGTSLRGALTPHEDGLYSLISKRWPSGSRRKQRVSLPCVTGSVRKVPPRRTQQLVCRPAVIDPDREQVVADVRVGGRRERDVGLVIGRFAALDEQQPRSPEAENDRPGVLAVDRRAQDVRYTRPSSATGSATTRMWVRAVSAAGNVVTAYRRQRTSRGRASPEACSIGSVALRPHPYRSTPRRDGHSGAANGRRDRWLASTTATASARRSSSWTPAARMYSSARRTS